ncbi:hypothetical protein AB0B31_12955 [Catellatospora citrea]|uniref:hypothetical protein n=1 Tax=Catellatospora citrea TaxID=53366 RepID=UPI0033FE9FA1
MRRGTVVMAAGWLVAAAVTAAVAVAGVDTIGAGLLGGSGQHPVLSSDDVDRLLADELSLSPSAQPSPGAATPAPTGQPSAGAAIRSLSTPGGVVHASCAGGAVTLASWSPAQGYRADDPEPGPAREARIKFKKDKNEMRVVVTCRERNPSPGSSPTTTDHARDRAATSPTLRRIVSAGNSLSDTWWADNDVRRPAGRAGACWQARP